MRIACISDIHANLFALEAVLKDVRSQSPDLILSLGDQINLGPQPLEVMQLLHSEGIPCLLGNHEQRVLALRTAHDASLDAINFASIRWTKTQVEGVPLDYPLYKRIDGITFAHAAVDNPSMPLEETPEVDRALDALSTPLLVCGHYHNAMQRTHGGKTIFVTGAVGMAENGIPNTALYAIVDDTPAGVTLTPRIVPYDSAPLYDAFRRSGILEYCPIMSRVVHEAMTQNRCVLMAFMRHVRATMLACEEPGISERVWTLAGNTFAWKTAQTCTEYWGL